MRISLLGLILLPALGFSETWQGTSSSDLNTASNWAPPMVPLAADTAIFDSTVPSINLSPTASADFSVSAFNFPNSAQLFSFLFDQCVLTFNGAGITGNATNTTIVSDNINNSLSIAGQFQFVNNTMNAIGSANLTAVNSGTLTTGTGMSSSLLGSRQIFSQFPSSMQDSAQLTAVNTGNDSSSGTGNNSVGSTNFYSQIEFDSTFNAGNNAGITATNEGTCTGASSTTGNNVGFVGNPQCNIGNELFVGNAFSFLVTNTGTDSSTGTVGNQVGFVGDNQIELDNALIAGSNLTIQLENTGTNTGSAFGGSTGFVDGSMLSISGAFHSGNSLTITATNSGANHCAGTGGGGNKVGRLSNDILEFDNAFFTGNNSTLTTVNSGACAGAYATAGNDVGYVGSFQIGANSIQAGDNFTVTLTNSGADSSTGVGGNNVGYCANTQFQLGAMTLGNHATITVTNSGAYTGSNSMSGNNVGYTGNPQISQSGAFVAQDFFTLIVSNEGADSSTGAGGSNNVGHIDDPQTEWGSFTVGNNAYISLSNSGANSTSANSGTTGYIASDQFNSGGPFVAGDVLTLIASNTATNSSPSTNVGVINGSQITFQDTCTLGDGALIKAINAGTGSVNGNQINFANGFTLAGKATIMAINEGSVLSPCIRILGNQPGGDANIVLQGANLFVGTSAPFTIGQLNGDSASVAQSTQQLIIQLDSGVSATFEGVIEDVMGPSTLEIAGSGTQILTGANTFTGLTTVQGGTLLLMGGSLAGDVLVNPLGTFGGNGTAHDVTNTGTIAPGASIGTMHFNSYANNGGTYDVEVNGVPESDLILVDTTATLSGGTVVVGTVDGTYSFQTPYTILQAGTRTGTFSNVTAISPSINPVLSYDAQHVFLTLLQNFAAVAHTHNQRNVAKGLDSINPTPLQQRLMGEIASLSAEDATRALDSLSGWQYTTNLWFSQSVNAEFLKRLYDPLRFLLTPNKQCAPCDKATVWVEGGATLKDLHGNPNAHGLQATGGEVTLGLQKSFGCHWTLGLAGSYEHDHIRYRRDDGSSSSNIWLGGIYGLYTSKSFYALADGTYGYASNKMHRNLNVGELKMRARSHPKLSMASVYGEVGGGWSGNTVAFQPFLGVIAGRNWDNHVHEKGGDGWAMHIDKKDCNLVKSRLGIHLTAQPGAAYICADLAWDKRFTGAHSSIGGEFVTFGDHFVIEGVSLNSNSFDYALTIGGGKKCSRFYVQASGEYWNKANILDVLIGFQHSW